MHCFRFCFIFYRICEEFAYYIYIYIYFFNNAQEKTRCRPSKRRRCIPDVDIEVHVETYLNVDLSSSAQVKIQVKFNFELFWRKKNQIFGFPWCSTREDLFIDVSITNVGLILTKLRWFLLFVKSQNSNFELSRKKNQIFGFPWCSTHEDLSIDVSITNVGLILTKLRWFQLFIKSQNSNFELSWKKKSNFWISMV